MYLWNPLNVVDGEARWFLHVIAWIFGGWLLLNCAHFLARKFLHKKHPEGFFWFEMVFQSCFKPFVVFIWFFVFLEGIDVVCDRYLSDVFKKEVHLIIKLVGLLVIGWILLRLKSRITRHMLAKVRHDEGRGEQDTITVISKLISAIIFVSLCLTALDIMGVSLTTLLAFGGVSGLAIAIAAQEVIANFFGSLMIHITRAFRIGDYIVLTEQKIEGYVRHIGWYQTTVAADSTRLLAIPNSIFTKAIVANRTRISHRLLDETVSVSLDDLPKVPVIIKQIKLHLKNHSALDKSEKMNVWIRSVSPTGIDIGLFALSHYLDEEQFLELRDTILISMVKEVLDAGAKLVNPSLVALHSHQGSEY